MKQWAYVICELVDGLPSFRHSFVFALDEQGAYAVGHRDVPQPQGNGLNDYVFELPNQEEA